VGLLMLSEPAQRPPSAPGATTDAALAHGPAARLLGALRGLLRSQFVASLGLAPLSLVFFQQLSLLGLLANLVAIPLVTLVITPLTMLGVLVAPLWGLAALGVQAGSAGLAWLAAWPGAVWQVPAAPAWAVASGLAAAVIGLLPGPKRLRWLALPLVLPLLWPAVPRPAPGLFSLVAADVGQGTAVLVRTQGAALLYDTGAQYSRENDAGQRVLVPLLRTLGVRRLDTLVLSHRDIDHVGGAASLLAGLPVGLVRSSLEPSHALLAGRMHQPCRAGQAWQHDGVRFEFLHPTEADAARPGARPNALSCVLRITDARGRSVLLAGDIEAAQEAALVQRLGPALRSEVLLVPHHGSRTSSTAAWLAAVQPRVAVVQAGYRNRFGHPAPEVLARHAGQGIAVVRSDQCGAWLWHDGAQTCTRQVQRRYWHWASPEAGADVANPGGGVSTP
jgi:competence protein ComEC